MFQFGEILTLAICAVTVIYVLSNWRRIRALPALRPFLGPFLLLVVAWIATVVEGFFLQGQGVPILVFNQESTFIAHQNLFSELFNLIEHLGYAAAGVWFFVLTWRVFQGGRESPS